MRRNRTRLRLYPQRMMKPPLRWVVIVQKDVTIIHGMDGMPDAWNGARRGFASLRAMRESALTRKDAPQAYRNPQASAMPSGDNVRSLPFGGVRTAPTVSH